MVTIGAMVVLGGVVVVWFLVCAAKAFQAELANIQAAGPAVSTSWAANESGEEAQWLAYADRS